MDKWSNDPPKAKHANLDLDNWYQWSPAKSWPMFRPTPVTLESELWPLRPVLSVFLWYPPPLSWVTSLVSRKSSSSLGSMVSRVSRVSRICHEAIFSYLVVASHWTLRTGWQPHWHWLVLRSHMTGRAPTGQAVKVTLLVTWSARSSDTRSYARGAHSVLTAQDWFQVKLWMWDGQRWACEARCEASFIWWMGETEKLENSYFLEHWAAEAKWSSSSNGDHQDPDTRLSLVWVKLKINQNDKDKTVTYHDKHIGTGQDSHDDNVLVNVTTWDKTMSDVACHSLLK